MWLKKSITCILLSVVSMCNCGSNGVSNLSQTADQQEPWIGTWESTESGYNSGHDIILTFSQDGFYYDKVFASYGIGKAVFYGTWKKIGQGIEKAMLKSGVDTLKDCREITRDTLNCSRIYGGTWTTSEYGYGLNLRRPCPVGSGCR